MSHQPSLLRADDRLLFQGDSITDCGREKQADGGIDNGARGGALGSGYPLMVAAQLAVDRPDLRIDVRNLGISGNRIVDLYARLEEHAWTMQPTVLSILIGVNDTWHGFMRRAGVDQARFAAVYRATITETRARLPDVRLILCEPFVLACGVVGAGWRADLDARRATIRALAAEHGATLVPFQDAFDAACATAPPQHWAPDGVHPSPAGHLLMTRTWLRAVGMAD